MCTRRARVTKRRRVINCLRRWRRRRHSTRSRRESIVMNLLPRPSGDRRSDTYRFFSSFLFLRPVNIILFLVLYRHGAFLYYYLFYFYFHRARPRRIYYPNILYIKMCAFVYYMICVYGTRTACCTRTLYAVVIINPGPTGAQGLVHGCGPPSMEKKNPLKIIKKNV